MKYFENIKNNIDFFLREHLKFSRKNYFEANESKEGLFEGLKNPQKALERENFLYEKYELEFLKSNSTRQNYLENLYIIDVLDKYFAPHPNPPPQGGREVHKYFVLDIGCKNWFYAKGEHAFFKKFCNNLVLDGIEIDTHRLYSNFYSRKEAAKFYIKGLENTEYIEGDFLNHNEKYDYMVWILPFVVENPLLKWGLPLRYFKPEEMLKKAYDLLKNGGSMLILNQGKAEHDIQIKLCEKLNINYTTFGEVKSEFLHYNIERYLMLIEK